MKEKLLALLKTKFAGVPDATLDRIATKKAETVTEESQLQTIADGVTYGDVLNSEVDHRVTSATRTAVQNYEKKHNLKEGVPVKKEEPRKNELPDDAPQWAKDLAKRNEELEGKLNGFEKSKTVGSLQQTVIDRLNGEFKNEKDQKLLSSWMKGRTIQVESEDEIETALTTLKNGFTEHKQEMTNIGIIVDPPAGGSGNPPAEKVAEEMKQWAESKKQSSETKTD